MKFSAQKAHYRLSNPIFIVNICKPINNLFWPMVSIYDNNIYRVINIFRNV